MNKKQLLLIASISMIVLAYLAGLGGLVHYPSSISLGPLTIHFYSLAILTGIFVVAYLVKKDIQNRKEYKKLAFEDLLLLTVIFGIIGARLWHLMTDWYLYQANPVTALYIWNGGLGIYGAILGGVVTIVIYLRRKKMPILPLLESLFLYLPIAQIIGRFGNFFNGELFGSTTSLPWGVYVPNENRIAHPTFLYEQILNLILFFVLYKVFIKKDRRGKGYVIAGYLIGYGLVRFLVDFARLEPRVFWEFTTAQFTSLLLIVCSTIFIILKKRHVKN